MLSNYDCGLEEVAEQVMLQSTLDCYQAGEADGADDALPYATLRSKLYRMQKRMVAMEKAHSEALSQLNVERERCNDVNRRRQKMESLRGKDQKIYRETRRDLDRLHTVVSHRNSDIARVAEAGRNLGRRVILSEERAVASQQLLREANEELCDVVRELICGSGVAAAVREALHSLRNPTEIAEWTRDTENKRMFAWLQHLTASLLDQDDRVSSTFVTPSQVSVLAEFLAELQCEAKTIVYLSSRVMLRSCYDGYRVETTIDGGFDLCLLMLSNALAIITGMNTPELSAVDDDPDRLRHRADVIRSLIGRFNACPDAREAFAKALSARIGRNPPFTRPSCCD